MTTHSIASRQETPPHFHRAYLGLGGNIGEVSRNMACALDLLCADGNTKIIAVSSQYRTPPWGNTDQPWFINACAAIHTRLEPLALLAACLDVEAQLHRLRTQRWGPRSMDMDILLYEDVVLKSEALTIPHPRMSERAFVLVPLAEIEPELVIDGRTIAELAENSDLVGMEPLLAAADWYGQL